MSSRHSVSRRGFLKTTLAGAAAYGLTARSRSQVAGANDDVRIAVVGINGRGGDHIAEWRKINGVRLVALCDVDLNVLNKPIKGLEDAQRFQDIRKLLESREIDAISVATTNHWHSLATVWACQAGKDVYVEKPCSHNVFEGRKCVEAARKYNRMVQHGTQQRGSEGAVAARLVALVKSGVYGKLLVSKGYCCKPRWSIGTKPITDPPSTLDFNIWLGPAPQQPYHANLVHYNWHWFWDFGNGDMGNQGVHEMDVARWAIGRTLPRSVVSLGGRYVNTASFKDQGQTPNQIVSVFDYGDCLLLFETRGLVKDDKEFAYKPRVQNELYFERGVVRGDKFYADGKGEGEALAKVAAQYRQGSVFQNFIDCVRSRRRERLHADILEAHLSSALCHLGNISYRLGKERPFEKPKDLGDNAVVGQSIMTMLENTKAIGVEPEKATLTVGPKLDFDAEKEKFVNNTEADGLLTREYRAPFVVPEQV